MQIVSIKGKQSNCEAAKHKIEELVGLSMKGKSYSGSEVRVCACMGCSNFTIYVKHISHMYVYNYDGVARLLYLV